MTAADGRATDAALGRSGTATPATPLRAAPRGQPSRKSEPPAGRSGSTGAVAGGAAGADSPAARRSASADARAGGRGPSGDSGGRGLSAGAPLGGVASTDNGTGEAAGTSTPAGESTPAHPQAGRSASAEPGPGPARAAGADTPAVRPDTATDTEAAPRVPSGGPAALGSPAASGTSAPSGAPAPSGGPAPSGTQTPSGTPATAPPGTPPPVDTMAAVVRQWQAVHPGIDTGPMEIIGRINRSAALLQQAEDAPLRRAGLTRPEFDVLGTLRRTGHELTPSEIARETFSSGAAVTKRLKQLTERGLVERRGDTRDRRVAHVRLTDAGRDLVDGILPQQLAYETTALSGIDLARQRELADLLGELLGQLEGRLGVPRA